MDAVATNISGYNKQVVRSGGGELNRNLRTKDTLYVVNANAAALSIDWRMYGKTEESMR